MEGCSQRLLTEILEVTILEEADRILTRPVTTEKVKQSMFAISGDKALGPDGFTSHFLKLHGL